MYWFMEDELADKVKKVIEQSNQPLETNEIQHAIKGIGEKVTRTKIFYRLNMLRGEGKINGKLISSGGKGVWIWWKK